MLTVMLCAPALAQGQTDSLSSKSADAAKAGDLPLDKVCLQRSNLYSAGAVVKMNEKPYVCKMDKNSGSGALSWVPMKQGGG
jgi:hypothetical protein